MAISSRQKGHRNGPKGGFSRSEASRQHCGTTAVSNRLRDAASDAAFSLDNPERIAIQKDSMLVAELFEGRQERGFFPLIERTGICR